MSDRRYVLVLGAGLLFLMFGAAYLLRQAGQVVASAENSREAAASVALPESDAKLVGAGAAAAGDSSPRTDFNCVELAPDTWGRDWTAEDMSRHRAELVASLSVSGSAEHLAVAAIVEEDPDASVRLIEEAVSRDDMNKLVLWTAVQVCGRHGGAAVCSQNEYLRRLTLLDSQNSEVWARLAVAEYSAEDRAEALEAMRSASAAAESRIYWPESAAMIERGYVAGSNIAFRNRALMALGMAPLPAYGGIMEMCQERASAEKEWAYACLGYAQLLETKGKTLLQQSLGLSLQAPMADALGENERAADIRARAESLKQTILAGSASRPAGFDGALVSSPAMFSAYLEAIATEGELQAGPAMAGAVKEALKQNPQLACE